MKVALACVVILVSSRLLLLLGAGIGWGFKPALVGLRDNTRNQICQFLGGVIGSTAAMVAAFYLFRWISADYFSTTIILVVGSISIVTPVVGEISRLLKLIKHEKRKPLISSADYIANMKANILGEVLGVFVGGALLLYLVQ